jgi:hypothetical protein
VAACIHHPEGQDQVWRRKAVACPLRPLDSAHVAGREEIAETCRGKLGGSAKPIKIKVIEV